MAISDQSTQKINAKINRTSISRIVYLRNILELVVSCFKDLSERVHRCHECGFETDRDVAAAMVVMQRGLAAVGLTVKMLGEELSNSSLLIPESPVLSTGECQLVQLNPNQEFHLLPHQHRSQCDIFRHL